jgi:hypothetical protein
MHSSRHLRPPKKEKEICPHAITVVGRFMSKKFINSFEVIDLSKKKNDHWATLKNLKGEMVDLKIPENVASEIHVGAVVAIYLEI